MKIDHTKSIQDFGNIQAAADALRSTSQPALVSVADQMESCMSGIQEAVQKKLWNNMTTIRNSVYSHWNRNATVLLALLGEPPNGSELHSSWPTEDVKREKVEWEVQELEAGEWSKVEGLDESRPLIEQLLDAREHAAGPLRVGTPAMRGKASMGEDE